MKKINLFSIGLLVVVGTVSFVSAMCSMAGGFVCQDTEICELSGGCMCGSNMINSGDVCDISAAGACSMAGGFICQDTEICELSGGCMCGSDMIDSGDVCDISATGDGIQSIIGLEVCGDVDGCICDGTTISVLQGEECLWDGQQPTLLSGETCNDADGCICDGNVINTGVICNISSCGLPRGGSLASGDIVTAYQNGSVVCGSTCVSEVRLCADGTLEGSYTNQSCSVASCGSSGGGGGGSSGSPSCMSSDLVCVDGLYEEKVGVNCQGGDLGEVCEVSSTGDDSSWYDNLTRIGDITNSPYSAELNLAYLYAYNMGITDMDNIFDANMEGNLIRSHMAKMLVEWAVNVMGLESDTDVVCDFDDIDGLQGQDLYAFVIDACQMGLMGLDSNGNPADSFNPYDVVTRAQFGTVLSRAIWGDVYNGANPYYVNHLNALNTISIMNYITNPWMLELRGYVMLMLFRADEIIN